jgi:signal peptidase II
MAEAATMKRAVVPSDDVRWNRKLGLGIALGVLILDQLVKWLVVHPLQLEARSAMGGDGYVIAPFFRFIFTANYGVSMGFLTADSQAMRWILVLLTAAISAFVLAWMWREKRRDDSIALALVLGGALGNILDRVRLGYVVDFADLHFGNHPDPSKDIHPFLVFNVGDAAITIGVLLLLVRALLTRDRKTPSEDK